MKCKNRNKGCHNNGSMANDGYCGPCHRRASPTDKSAARALGELFTAQARQARDNNTTFGLTPRPAQSKRWW